MHYAQGHRIFFPNSQAGMRCQQPLSTGRSGASSASSSLWRSPPIPVFMSFVCGVVFCTIVLSVSHY